MRLIRHLLLAIWASGTIVEAADRKRCRGRAKGEEDGKWIINPGLAEKWARNFCEQSRKKVIWGGDPVGMKFSVRAPYDSGKKMRDAPDCESKFVHGLIRGCDGDDPENYYNNKYGGTLKTDDGWMFKLTPTVVQTTDAFCDVKRIKDGQNLIIRGRNFDLKKFGRDGVGLLQATGMCELMGLYWPKFELTTDHPKWQWKITFGIAGKKQLRIPCIQRAIWEIGGVAVQCRDHPVHEWID